MKFGLFQEGDTHRGSSVTQRYHEIIREVQYAEELWFDTWGCSEQHFVGPSCMTTAPEVFNGTMVESLKYFRKYAIPEFKNTRDVVHHSEYANLVSITHVV